MFSQPTATDQVFATPFLAQVGSSIPTNIQDQTKRPLRVFTGQKSRDIPLRVPRCAPPHHPYQPHQPHQPHPHPNHGLSACRANPAPSAIPDYFNTLEEKDDFVESKKLLVSWATDRARALKETGPKGKKYRELAHAKPVGVFDLKQAKHAKLKRNVTKTKAARCTDIVPTRRNPSRIVTGKIKATQTAGDTDSESGPDVEPPATTMPSNASSNPAAPIGRPLTRSMSHSLPDLVDGDGDGTAGTFFGEAEEVDGLMRMHSLMLVTAQAQVYEAGRVQAPAPFLNISMDLGAFTTNDNPQAVALRSPPSSSPDEAGTDDEMDEVVTLLLKGIDDDKDPPRHLLE